MAPEMHAESESTDPDTDPTVPKLQFSADAYRIVIGDDASEPAPYGESLEVEINGKLYLAFADLKEGEEAGEDVDSESIETRLDSWVYEIAQSWDDVEIEDVEEFN